MKNNKKLLIILLILLIIIGGGAVWFAFFRADSSKDDSSTSAASSGSSGASKNATLVACTNTAATQPVTVGGWKTSLYAAPLSEDSSNDNVADNGTRTFSIAAISGKTSENDIYYRVQKIDNGYIAGTKVIIELCNADNKAVDGYTTTTTTTTPVGEDIVAKVSSLHGGVVMPAVAGEYRTDAYVYVDGTWYLTNRISPVTLTQ